MSKKFSEVISSRIWCETPELDNPFAASSCVCCGYDVYNDLLKNARYSDYLYLLFKHKQPSAEQSALLEGLAIALANPGPRDHSVRAAMSAGVGRSTHASALIAALAVGAGNLGGAREVFTALEYWQHCHTDLDKWQQWIADPPQLGREDICHPMEHAPGFDPNGISCPTPVKQTLAHLVEVGNSETLRWLQACRTQLEDFAGCPLAFSGVAAAVLYELEFLPQEAEMLFLLLRLPGAAIHSLEQERLGWRKYPFFGDGFKLTS